MMVNELIIEVVVFPPPGNTGEPVIVMESTGEGAPVNGQVFLPPTQVCDDLPSNSHQHHNLASPGGVISSHGYYSGPAALEQVSAQYPSLRGGFGAQLQSRGAHRGDMGTLFYSNNHISSPKVASRTVNTDHLPRESARDAQRGAPDSRANTSPREILIYNQAISDKGFSETNRSRSDSRANTSPREILIYNQAISDKGFSETNRSRSDQLTDQRYRDTRYTNAYRSVQSNSHMGGQSNSHMSNMEYDPSSYRRTIPSHYRPLIATTPMINERLDSGSQDEFYQWQQFRAFKNRIQIDNNSQSAPTQPGANHITVPPTTTRPSTTGIPSTRSSNPISSTIPTTVTDLVSDEREDDFFDEEEEEELEEYDDDNRSGDPTDHESDDDPDNSDIFPTSVLKRREILEDEPSPFGFEWQLRPNKKGIFPRARIDPINTYAAKTMGLAAPDVPEEPTGSSFFFDSLGEPATPVFNPILSLPNDIFSEMNKARGKDKQTLDKETKADRREAMMAFKVSPADETECFGTSSIDKGVMNYMKFKPPSTKSYSKELEDILSAEQEDYSVIRRLSIFQMSIINALALDLQPSTMEKPSEEEQRSYASARLAMDMSGRILRTTARAHQRLEMLRRSNVAAGLKHDVVEDMVEALVKKPYTTGDFNFLFGGDANKTARLISKRRIAEASIDQSIKRPRHTHRKNISGTTRGRGSTRGQRQPGQDRARDNYKDYESYQHKPRGRARGRGTTRGRGRRSSKPSSYHYEKSDGKAHTRHDSPTRKPRGRGRGRRGF